jgi:hypothetical protein
LTKSDEEKQQERLSAYLDNALAPDERSAFENEMKADPALQTSFEGQRAIKQNLSVLPQMRAPRNFTLDPAVYGRPTSSAVFRLYPVMRTATALAAVMIIFLFSLELFSATGGRVENVAFAPETASEASDTVANSQNSGAAEVAVQTEAETVEEAVEEAEAEMAEAPMEEPAQEPPTVFEAESAVFEEEAMEEEAAEEEEMADPSEESAADSDPNAAPEPAGGVAGGATEGDGTNDLASGESATTFDTVEEPTITATQRLSQTEQMGADTKGLEPVSPTFTYGTDDRVDDDQDLYGLDDSSVLTRSVLLGGLGVLFLVLLAGTWLLRRQM